MGNSYTSIESYVFVNKSVLANERLSNTLFTLDDKLLMDENIAITDNFSITSDTEYITVLDMFNTIKSKYLNVKHCANYTKVVMFNDSLHVFDIINEDINKYTPKKSDVQIVTKHFLTCLIKEMNTLPVHSDTEYNIMCISTIGKKHLFLELSAVKTTQHQYIVRVYGSKYTMKN